MAMRNLRIASARSACSAASFACSPSTAANSSSARRLTPPMRFAILFQAGELGRKPDPSAAWARPRSTPASAGRPCGGHSSSLRDVADEEFQPLLRRFRLRLQPGADFARRAHRLQRRARGAVGLGQRGFRHGAGVAGVLDRAFGLLDFLRQRAPLQPEIRPAPRPAAPFPHAPRSAGLRLPRSGFASGRARSSQDFFSRAIASRRLSRASASRAKACRAARASAAAARSRALAPANRVALAEQGRGFGHVIERLARFEQLLARLLAELVGSSCGRLRGWRGARRPAPAGVRRRWRCRAPRRGLFGSAASPAGRAGRPRPPPRRRPARLPIWRSAPQRPRGPPAPRFSDRRGGFFR